jgi:hypothetical protein
MTKILLFLFLSFITGLTYAQSDTSKLSSTHMIEWTKPTFFKVSKFYVDGKQQTVSEINTRLMNSPASAYEYKEYKKFRNLTYYTGGICVASLITSAIIAGNSSSFKKTTGNVLLAVGYAFIIPVTIFGLKRNKHYGRSIDSYNRQFQ